MLRVLKHSDLGKGKAMCLLLVAHQQHANYRLIVAANRDEFYARAAAPASFWSDNNAILGGRDLQANGTWLAVNRAGWFAAITNVRTAHRVDVPRSRGLIVSDYLSGCRAARQFVDYLAEAGASYEGFNVLTGDAHSVAWYSNHSDQAQTLASGVYGLSNHLLDTPWPKVKRIKADFLDAQALSETELIETMFVSLANEDPAPDAELPDTGISLEGERMLAPIFVTGESYGTRCSTIILVSHAGILTFVERRFGPNKLILGESRFKFELESPPI